MPVIPCFGPDEPGPRLTITTPPPLFFVSVASKGFRFSVSPLFSTLAREPTSVDFERLTEAIQLLESRGMRHEDLKELESRGQGARIRLGKELRNLQG